MEDRSRILRLHPGRPDRPRRHVPEQGALEDGDEGNSEVDLRPQVNLRTCGSS